ncbi:hypothetical protein [Kitasatospora purpeofusca]|uniref:hypothetical protein n=1 Tax=Kitasatospora purpeofusca TaxID=67352 RepID=UPI0035E27BCC
MTADASHTDGEPAPQAIVGGVVGPGGTEVLFDDLGRGTFTLRHLHPLLVYIVTAEMDESGFATITSFTVTAQRDSPKPTDIGSLRPVPLDKIRDFVESSFAKHFCDRPSAAALAARMEEFPTSGRRSSPDRFIVTAWLVKKAEYEGNSANKEVARYFGYGPNSAANVSRLIRETKERGYLNAKVPTQSPATPAWARMTTEEEVEAAVTHKHLNILVDRGGEVGRLAHLLLDELDDAAAGTPSTLTFDEGSVRALYPTAALDPRDGDEPYQPLPLEAGYFRAYKMAYDRIAISHRNARPEEIVDELTRAAQRCQLRFTDQAMRTQAKAIRSRVPFMLQIEARPPA